jgi:hypothetical protein
LSIVHGVNDPRCTISEARLFRDALLNAGYDEGEDGDFEYTELGEGGQRSTDIDDTIRTSELVADFLNRRMSAATVGRLSPRTPPERSRDEPKTGVLGRGSDRPAVARC